MELTEHLKKGSEEYDRLTKTVTESGKEMVNGVAKNYKTVTKYVTENGKTTAQTQKVYEEIAATVAKTLRLQRIPWSTALPPAPRPSPRP